MIRSTGLSICADPGQRRAETSARADVVNTAATGSLHAPAIARLDAKAATMLTAKNPVPIGVRHLLDRMHLLLRDAPALSSSTSTAPLVVCSIGAIHAAATARSVRCSTCVLNPALAVSASSAAYRSQPNTRAQLSKSRGDAPAEPMRSAAHHNCFYRRTGSHRAPSRCVLNR